LLFHHHGRFSRKDAVAAIARHVQAGSDLGVSLPYCVVVHYGAAAKPGVPERRALLVPPSRTSATKRIDKTSIPGLWWRERTHGTRGRIVQDSELVYRPVNRSRFQADHKWNLIPCRGCGPRYIWRQLRHARQDLQERGGGMLLLRRGRLRGFGIRFIKI